MSNYNIEVDLLKIPGAKVMDIQGNTETRTCICLPIDSKAGTVTDSYFVYDGFSGEEKEIMKKSVTLSLRAYDWKDKSGGCTHGIKANVSRDILSRMTDDDKRRLPWVGTMKPWTYEAKNKGNDW